MVEGTLMSVSRSVPLRIVRDTEQGSGLAKLDVQDLDQVFRQFAPYVSRIATRILGHHDEVEDLVQDVFLDAHKGIRALRDPESVRYWLATVTVRKAKKRISRRRWLHWIGLEPDLDTSRIVDTTASSDTRAFIASIYTILNRLQPDARIAWIMHRIEDEPLEKIAEICGCSRATAHRRLQEAQDTLTKELK